MFRPFKNQVIDCVVTQVSVNGFFAEAGPISMFTSAMLLHEDMKFEYGDEPAFFDGQSRLKKDSWVRLRIVGLQKHANDFQIITEMKVSWPVRGVERRQI